MSSYFKIPLWYFLQGSYSSYIFFYWNVDTAFNTVFIWYFSDYPNEVTSQHGTVASKDNRYLSNDISGSTQRKKPHQITDDVILRIVSPIKGSYPTRLWYFWSIRIWYSSIKSKYEYHFPISFINEINALIYGTGDTGKKKGNSIRQYLCSSSKNQTKRGDNMSDGQNGHDLAVIKDNPKVWSGWLNSKMH